VRLKETLLKLRKTAYIKILGKNDKSSAEQKSNSAVAGKNILPRRMLRFFGHYCSAAPCTAGRAYSSDV